MRAKIQPYEGLTGKPPSEGVFVGLSYLGLALILLLMIWVFGLDFALFTLAMALSVWLSGLLLDNTGLDPRQLSFLLAFGGLLPLLPWLWINRSDPQRLASSSNRSAD